MTLGKSILNKVFLSVNQCPILPAGLTYELTSTSGDAFRSLSLSFATMIKGLQNQQMGALNRLLLQLLLFLVLQGLFYVHPPQPHE